MGSWGFKRFHGVSPRYTQIHPDFSAPPWAGSPRGFHRRPERAMTPVLYGSGDFRPGGCPLLFDALDRRVTGREEKRDFMGFFRLMIRPAPPHLPLPPLSFRPARDPRTHHDPVGETGPVTVLTIRRGWCSTPTANSKVSDRGFILSPMTISDLRGGARYDRTVSGVCRGPRITCR